MLEVSIVKTVSLAMRVTSSALAFRMPIVPGIDPGRDGEA